MMLSIQGGGIYIDGSADLTDCNIHDNVATDVSPLLKLNPHSVVSHSPAPPLCNVTRAHRWQDGFGGGLAIRGTATLTNTNAYDNRADRVCLPFELFLSFHPAPRWNVTFDHVWQSGGGLYIIGTATLTNTNVYSNEASYVCWPSALA